MEKINGKKCFLVSYNGLSNSGGVEKVCFYLNKIMTDKGYDVIVVDKNLVEKTKYAKIFMGVFGKLHVIAFTFFASLFIRNNRNKGDVKIAHGFNAPFFKNDYLFIHGTLKGYCLKTKTRISWSHRILFQLERIAVKNADKILAVSQNAIDEVKQYYTKAERQYFVVHNGVDDTTFLPLNEKKGNTYINVLYCGRLDEGKGLQKLLELARLVEKTENFKFSIACNNSNNADLFDGLQKTLICVGLNHENINTFYNSGDIFFFPSHYEGFEMVTLEALSAGIPVLGNNVGAVGELKNNNDPGVDIIDFENILQQIKTMIETYKDRSTFLHDYYKNSYGLDCYINKLNKIIV
ncbi:MULTISPECIES: glycosyltransferase family 4 protein [Sphingobacterium]|uniref:glycosyltransferase family 4 protein n=1 Tax=Sphingobacterium TaxID=28453 RepID=UPI00257A1D88|nr:MULTISPECIES: glycosyltransferase family 4 protein [Sphingobacterium]